MALVPRRHVIEKVRPFACVVAVLSFAEQEEAAQAFGEGPIVLLEVPRFDKNVQCGPSPDVPRDDSKIAAASYRYFTAVRSFHEHRS